MNIYQSHSSHPLLGDGGGGGGLSHFSERLYWDFGWELALQVGVIFFRWDLKTPYIKNSEYKSQAKKDSVCNFYNFSLLIPYPNKFVVFVLIFSMVYTPPYPQIFFLWGAIFFFSCPVARGWEYFRFLGDLLYWEVLFSFLGKGG